MTVNQKTKDRINRLADKVMASQQSLLEKAEVVGALQERLEILNAYMNGDAESFQDWFFQRCEEDGL